MSDPLGLETSRERTAFATAAYEALRKSRKLAGHRLLSYRCPRRCLLLDVVGFPEGVVFHRPRYKLSPALNDESSNAAGRSANTLDGSRRWKANTAFAAQWVNVPMNCDHVRVTIEKDDIQADLDARHSEVTVTSTGERRAQVD